MGWVTALAALLLGASVDAQTHGDAPRARGRATQRRPSRPRLPPSASLGWANSGTLVHGRHLAEGDGVRFMPGRVLHWGTEELVALLERVGASMRRRFGVRITVGDLSAEHGGPIGHHRSHQSGRDADVGFYARLWTARGPGASVELDDYVSFDANGRSLDGRYVFDTARNWALLEALLTERRVGVERIFISAPLRARLLAYAREHGVASSVINEAALTLLQPRRVSPHDNHFHVRIECPDGDNQCREGVRARRVPRRRPARASHGRQASAQTHGERGKH
ncbi:MAG: penicillin-insensitive murein endopeptidase [Polyangiales bacterium]